MTIFHLKQLFFFKYYEKVMFLLNTCEVCFFLNKTPLHQICRECLWLCNYVKTFDLILKKKNAAIADSSKIIKLF